MLQQAHPDLRSLARALDAHPVWFPADADWSSLPPSLQERSRLYSHGEARVRVVERLQAGDLTELAQHHALAWVAEPSALVADDMARQLGPLMAEGRWRLFGTPRSAALARLTPLGPLEFLLSSSERLRRMPTRALPAWRGSSLGRRRRAVFVFDLIQDIEILSEFVLRAALGHEGLEPCAAITDRVLNSHLGPELTRLLQSLGVPWFKPVGAVDVATALGDQPAVLLTASESTAPGHAFAHACCRLAPPRTLRVTFQHGFECVGLLHHRAHDQQFPLGLRFASDLIFTWRPADELTNLSGADAGRTVAVGVTKAIAQRAETLLTDAWSRVQPWPEQPAAPESDTRLLVAENLHSVRFSSPARFRRFQGFIEELAGRPGAQVVIRSHPGKRTLERQPAGRPYVFLEGNLRAEHLFACGGVVSPPSTIVLDAALCARPVAVWTDTASLGDAANYAGLPRVRDVADLAVAFGPAAGPGPAARADEQACLASLSWAVRNTTALNGVGHAWHQLCARLA